MNTNHKSEKQNVRKFLIDRRNELSSEHEERNNSHIHIRALLEDAGKCKIGSYLPFRNEMQDIHLKDVEELYRENEDSIDLKNIEISSTLSKILRKRMPIKMMKASMMMVMMI